MGRESEMNWKIDAQKPEPIIRRTSGRVAWNSYPEETTFGEQVVLYAAFYAPIGQHARAQEIAAILARHAEEMTAEVKALDDLPANARVVEPA